MKTIKQIQNEIDSFKKNDVTEKEKNKINNKIKHLRQLIYYLESGVTESFLIKEKDALEFKLKAIEEMCKGLDKIDMRSVEKAYNANSLKKQLKTINFLLI